MTLRMGSLCTGYGGIELGLELANVPHRLAWYAEVEPALVKLLAGHQPDLPNLGDIREVDWSTVEPVDLLVGGIPCQPTSAAGKRLGSDDPRWLWPAARDAVDILRPGRFLLENVGGLVTHSKGALWSGIMADLNGLGYGVRWLTLGACAVGLAHHRHRVFLLAELGGSGSTRLDVPECGVRRGSHPLLVTPAARDTKGDPAVHRGRAKGAGTLGESLTLLPSPNASDGNSGPGMGTRAEGSTYLRSVGTLLPMPRASDGVNGGPNQRGAKGDLAMPSAVQPERWGRFEWAVQRHADAVWSFPPEPTMPNRNGGPRLRPEFVEWLMGVPAGWVTDALPRAPALKALGNGVVPLQLAVAWTHLTGGR